MGYSGYGICARYIIFYIYFACMITEKIIFWDWNGTLLNDAETCMTTMNKMLQRRKMPELSIDLYKEVFGFPVVKYYQKIGFNFTRESFEALSVEFIDAYNQALGSAPLVRKAVKVLAYFKNEGKVNVMISAMRHDMLLKSVEEKGISEYFTDILGIDNIYAASKSKIALEYVSRKSLDISDIILIGDTTHDYEVAKDIGCRCILVADGHQSEKRLRSTDAEIIPALTDLLPPFK